MYLVIDLGHHLDFQPITVVWRRGEKVGRWEVPVMPDVIQNRTTHELQSHPLLQ